jgi:F-type H+-transporting ATPase subunit epsilon
MKLDIVTPEGALFSGEVDSIVVPGVNGAFEMLNNHAPIIASWEQEKCVSKAVIF